MLSDAGTGLNSDVICGIDYVAAHADEIEVANMSLGGGGEDDGNCGLSNDDAMHTAICNAVAAGITFVVAAGNDSADASTSTPTAGPTAPRAPGGHPPRRRGPPRRGRR